LKEKEKIHKINKRWLSDQRKIIMKLTDTKEKEMMDDFTNIEKK
jgi:hypothetical protein